MKIKVGDRVQCNCEWGCGMMGTIEYIKNGIYDVCWDGDVFPQTITEGEFILVTKRLTGHPQTKLFK